jgi:hypothetical protein
VDIIVTGYTHNSEVYASLLKKTLEDQGHEVVVIDVFSRERKKWLFRKTLLTTSDHTAAVKTAEREFFGLDKLNEKIGTVYTHSYGVVSILASTLKAKEYVLVAPPLGEAKWKTLEKLFFFLPGFRELRKGILQKKLFDELLRLKVSGKKVTIIVSSLEKDCFGDDCVSYPEETFKRMLDVARRRSLRKYHAQTVHA